MLLLLLLLMVCWNLLRVLQLIHRLLKNNLDAIIKKNEVTKTNYRLTLYANNSYTKYQCFLLL